MANPAEELFFMLRLSQGYRIKLCLDRIKFERTMTLTLRKYCHPVTWLIHYQAMNRQQSTLAISM